jgi:UDP-GlcNAc:undecaprenyl-phosphate GlcNAc-1-phosphate transferase
LSDEVRLAGSFALALIATVALVPLAIRVALRTGFMDVPVGYKGHARPTPYLGGAAVASAVAVTVLAFGVATSRFAPILIWGLVLLVVGTVDDKRTVRPAIRLAIEVLAAGALWYYGLGWTVLPGDAANLALTVFWVVGVVNAFNLMDNMDGAAPTVAAISAAGTAALALVEGNVALAVMVLAVAGAAVGFIPYNLARPSRIFLGDGGSMPLGFIIAAAVMVIPMQSDLGWVGLFAAVPLIGLPILDTTLVVISRRRGSRPILSGGRDHVTHRLSWVLGSPRTVALCLAGVQTALCLTAVVMSQLDLGWGLVMAFAYVLAGAFAIYVLETPGRGRLVAAAGAVQAGSAAPEESAA